MTFWLVYAVSGKLIIYLFQISPFSKYLTFNRDFLKEMYECDLCLGVWIYFLLALGLDIPTVILNISYNNIIEKIILSFVIGAATSFLVWVFSAGWNEKFRIMEIK